MVRELGLPLGAGRPHRGRRHDAREGQRQRLGDRRRRRGARPRQAPPGAQPAHLPARDPPGPARRRATWPPRSAGGKPQPFRYRTLGVFVDMGQHKAVATMLGVRLRGFPAWFAARTYHLAMMPGMARRVRLGDRLDRGPAVRPRLGRARPARAPAVAGDYLDDAREQAKRPTGERAHLPRGPRERPARPSFELGEAALDASRARARPAARGRSAHDGRSCATRWAHERPLLEFIAAQPGGCFLRLRGRRRAGRLRARRPLRRDGRAGRAVGRARARRPRASAGGCSSAAGPSRPRPSSGGSWWRSARPADLTLYTEFGVMPVSGHWHMRHRGGPLPRAARAQEMRRDRAGRARAHAGPRRGGVEAARAGRDRPRAPAAARVLRPHAQLPRHRRRLGRPRPGSAG